MWFSWTSNPEDLARDRYRKLGVKPDTLIQPPKRILTALAVTTLRSVYLCPST